MLVFDLPVIRNSRTDQQCVRMSSISASSSCCSVSQYHYSLNDTERVSYVNIRFAFVLYVLLDDMHIKLCSNEKWSVAREEERIARGQEGESASSNEDETTLGRRWRTNEPKTRPNDDYGLTQTHIRAEKESAIDHQLTLTRSLVKSLAS